MFYMYCFLPIPVVVPFKAWVCSRLLAGIAGSNLPGAWMSLSCENCVLSDLCVWMIARTEESFRVYCVLSVIVNPR